MKDLKGRNYDKFSATNKDHYCCKHKNRQLEIYMFVDPICPECWALEPILKKLQIEYGQYFSLKYVLSGRLATLNINSPEKCKTIANMWEKTASRTGISCDGRLWLEDPVSSPFIASIAIKAAELQGRSAGRRFLRKLQEVLFLKNKNISNFDVLVQCAKEVNLDIDEFISDIHSNCAAKAFQCDLKITTEMEVTENPTLVFFNENIEEDGIKISGYYPYEIYEQILFEMLNTDNVHRADPPPLVDFLQWFKLVSAADLAIVYNMSLAEVETEMKKLILQQLVVKLPIKHGSVWKYIGDDF